MDAFYASVEQRDHPEWRGKPIAVGGHEKRGVITTASYEARKFGVRSAMPGWKAAQLCPELIFVPLRFEAYKAVSKKIRAIFYQYTDLVEPLSLDEAYLDVTQNKINEPIATEIAKKIKADILSQTGLTASAGVSYCKFLAKIASDYRKPNGLTVIRPQQALPFIAQLDISKFYGVGQVTALKMRNLGINNGADLREHDLPFLISHFGKSGSYFYNIARGIDNRIVEPNQVRKSLAYESTFETNLTTTSQVLEQINKMVPPFFARLDKYQFWGKTLTVKIKDNQFQIKTRSITKDRPFTTQDEILTLANQLIEQNEHLITQIRLIGLTISNPGNS